jgi:SAM-dependent methyltransferase
MKTRESGMPEEELWETFFQPKSILEKLGLKPGTQFVVDFGCGYGTFSLPVAKMIEGRVVGLDIDPDMVAFCAEKARANGIGNTTFEVRDFVAEGTEFAGGTADYVMLFNILHAERPDGLLREAHRILAPGGMLAVIHWNYDPATPRGPSTNIRPRPEDCRRWMEENSFSVPGAIIELPPWHYGLIGFPV